MEKQGEAEGGEKPEVWRLVGINTPGPLELALTGESFVVGRSVQRAQGVVSFSPTIGREHCRFLLKDGKWYLENLNSTNGTFLNGIVTTVENRQDIM